MNNIELLKSRFPNIRVSSEKIETDNQLFEILKYLKDTPEYSFDVLVSIIAVDYLEYIELIYTLISTSLNERVNISIKVTDSAQSVVELFKSAYFDECEIYDLFGLKFDGNINLKRLFMPLGWVGHPLKKTYVQNDERLSWNG